MSGVDAIKLIYEDGGRAGRPTNPMMKPEIMRAIIDEAHKQNLKVYVHALNLNRAKEALEAGADGMVHTVLSERVDNEYIRLMKKNRAVFIKVFEVCHRCKMTGSMNTRKLQVCSRALFFQTKKK